MAKRSLAELMRQQPDIDRARIAATTEEEIRRHAIEDGDDPDEAEDGRLIVPPSQEVRRRLGLTQEAFAALLRIPVGTIRNWEQNRKLPDPAARTLLGLIAADPSHAFRLLSQAEPQRRVPEATV